MKIKEVSTYLASAGYRNLVLVKVTTDTGLVGWGEATVEGKEVTVAAAVSELERYLVGKDPLSIELHWQRMYRDAFWVGGPILLSAISGVEHALWDIAGQYMHQPIYQLLGGAMRTRIKTYANGWFFGAKTPAEFAERAAATVEKGFRALKWDPFGEAGLFPEREQMDAAVECVRAVREAVGPKIDLLIEVHGRLSVAHAIQMAHELAPFKPFFYEEPVPPENLDALKKVSDAIPIPVATGERLFTKWGYKDLLEKQAAVIIQPDPSHDGGILETKKIAAMAETYYVGVAPHNPNGAVSTAVCLQIDANIPNFLIQEMNVADYDSWVIRLLHKPFAIVDGYIEVPSGPGLGIEVNEEELKKHPYQPRLFSLTDVNSMLREES